MSDNDKTVAVIESVDIQALITRALEKESPIEVMERLLVMRRELNAERAQRSYFEQLAAFQADCPVIGRSAAVDYNSKKGGRVHYRFAPIAEIAKEIKEPMQKHGFSFTVKTRQEPASVTAIVTIHHDAGHSESTEFAIPIDPEAYMNAAQKVGTALSYAKRYALCNGLGLVTGDEDTDVEGADAIKEPQAVSGVKADAEGRVVPANGDLKAAQSTLQDVYHMLKRPVGADGVVLYTKEEMDAKVAEAKAARDDIEKLRELAKAWSEEFTERGASYAFNQEKEKA